ncbi:MAG: hypothetical protein HYX20_02245 [Candidatus Yanofskybacteria bacterium]|nr:hypothetical protein [Candidatus Yanofskybacteria bacterium]
MNINRRKIRKALGSRTERRKGTKTKVIPGTNSQNKGPSPCFRFPRRQKPRVSVRVEAAIRQLMAEKQAAGQA